MGIRSNVSRKKHSDRMRKEEYTANKEINNSFTYKIYKIEIRSVNK